MRNHHGHRVHPGHPPASGGQRQRARRGRYLAPPCGQHRGGHGRGARRHARILSTPAADKPNRDEDLDGEPAALMPAALSIGAVPASTLADSFGTSHGVNAGVFHRLDLGRHQAAALASRCTGNFPTRVRRVAQGCLQIAPRVSPEEPPRAAPRQQRSHLIITGDSACKATPHGRRTTGRAPRLLSASWPWPKAPMDPLTSLALRRRCPPPAGLP